MRAEEPPGDLGCCGGLPFLNIIKTYLFCVPHEEHPRSVTEVGRPTQSQAHPAPHGSD